MIAADGTVLETFVPPRFASLPLVVGDGAEHAAHDILDLLERYPAIAKGSTPRCWSPSGAGTCI